MELVTAICLQATERRGMVAADYAGRAAATPAAPVDLDLDPAPTEIDSDEDFYVISSGRICCDIVAPRGPHWVPLACLSLGPLGPLAPP